MAQHHKLYNKALLPRFRYTLLVFALVVFSIVPLNAQKNPVKYSDKNMQWIISRLNTKLTFEEFSEQFKGAEMGDPEKYMTTIHAVKSLEGETYVYSSKYVIYRVFVDKSNRALYARANGKIVKREDKSGQRGLYDLPVYTYKKDEYVSEYSFNDSVNPLLFYFASDYSNDYLYWGDREKQLLIRLNIQRNSTNDIEVMVNGWYKSGNIPQFKRKDGDGKIQTLPMDFDQLQNLEELQRPKEKLALVERLKAAWEVGKSEDLLELDFTQKKGICVTGCEQLNGEQQIFFKDIYYDGPVKNGLPHGKANYVCLIGKLEDPDGFYQSILTSTTLDREIFTEMTSVGLVFENGKAQGKVTYNPYQFYITYNEGKAIYTEEFETDAELKVLDADGYIAHITGPLNNGQWTEDTEFHTFDPDSSKVYYKGEVNEAYAAQGKGTFYEYYIPASEESKVSYKQKSRLKATVAATWSNGEISKNHLATLKSYTWTFSGVGIDLDIKKGVASGERITVIRNKTPEYRGTGKMTPKPCPTGIWTLEKFNSETNEYVSVAITDEYIIEGGYCMFKGSFDEDGNEVDNVNLFKRQDYITPEERKILIARQKKEQEEADRLKAVASQKRFEEEQKKKRALLDNFELLLKKAVGSNAKIASEGWMTNFLDGETTGTAGLFIINTNSSSKSFSGTVSYSHPTNGSEEKDITVRVGGADSSGYGGAYTSFNLGYGSPYQLKLKLNGNTSGIYYFIYYKGLLIK